MYRRDIPLIPAEEIGYHLGLTVPPEESDIFYNVRIAKEPPVGSGFGTQIQTPGYNPNSAFGKLNIPLRFSTVPASDIGGIEKLMQLLAAIQQDDKDALHCFNHGVIRGEYKPFTGHVVVFDRIVDDMIRIVDPSWKNPKWRLIEPALMYEAIVKHGDPNGGGIWRFDLIDK